MARAQALSETVQFDPMDVIEHADQLLKLASGDARPLVGTVGDQDVVDGSCHLLCHLGVVKAPLVRASCNLMRVPIRVPRNLVQATSQAVEDYVHIASASRSSTGSRPVDRASTKSEPQRRVTASMGVVAVVVDIDAELGGVADTVTVESEMPGYGHSVVVVDNVEVGEVIVYVDRNESGAETRYVLKARGSFVHGSAVAVGHRVIDSGAQHEWAIEEAERCGHSGDGSSCGCSETVGSGGSQCSDGGESPGTC